jgi:uncharacterized Zn finger protein
MKCPKCGSERIQKIQYCAEVINLMTYKYMGVVRCERCGFATRHECWDDGEAMVIAEEMFKAAAEVEG